MKNKSETTLDTTSGWAFWVMMVAVMLVGKFFGLVGAMIVIGVWGLISYYQKTEKSTEVKSFNSAVVQPSSPRSENLQTMRTAKVTVQEAHQVESSPKENFWSAAYEELESTSRRAGLWARSFSEAGGDEAVAKAKYLAVRSSDLEEEHRQSEIKRLEEDDKKRQLEEFSRLMDAERAYALLPKGTCPNCAALILLTSEVCPKCKAVFGFGSAWKVIPKDSNGV